MKNLREKYKADDLFLFQLVRNKYQTQLISSLIINNLHYNFIILNNKLIFTHSLNKLQIKELKKLLKKHYYKYKLV